jgi:glycosyltransferase involved in cell wall biosynthesis
MKVLSGAHGGPEGTRRDEPVLVRRPMQTHRRPMSDAPLRVALYAHVDPSVEGGIQQATVGVVGALSSLGGDDDFAIVTRLPAEWLAPYVHPPCRLVRWNRSLTGAVSSRLHPTRPRRSDGTAESLGAELVHFLTQHAFLTDIPTIYQPWDLQHVHFPEFFSPQERARRDSLLRVYCQSASLVIVASSWVRRDVVEWSGVPESRVRVVAPASILDLYGPSPDDNGDAVLEKLDVTTPFALYPARPWPHKNHDRLLDALALLHHRGIDILLVCTGAESQDTARLSSRCISLGIEKNVRFTGFVLDSVLAVLYRRARLLVFPSLFEGFGLPVLEAMSVGLPVVCSNATGLGELVGDGGITFNPADVDAIAQAIGSTWTDDALLASLSSRARVRAASYSWETTALRYRALYRELAGRTLNDADRTLVADTSPP